SPVARQAHNLKVAGSNPAPATKSKPLKANSFQGLSHVRIGPLLTASGIKSESFGRKFPRALA
ncbi:hypothetical protein, partial [Azospirillum argentinense]